MGDSQPQRDRRRPEFVAVGHVTRDLLPGGEHTLGGTVSYAALTASRLGCSAAVFTSGPPAWALSAVLPGIDVHVVPSTHATTFENIYRGAGRQQCVHAVADPLPVGQLPAEWRRTPILLLAPVVHEIGTDWLGRFPNSLVAVTPQGWLRTWDEDGRVRFRRWAEAEQVISEVDVLIFSEEDVESDESLVLEYAGAARLAVVTRGSMGATLFVEGESQESPAFRAQVVDPTGAGDVFAAAFLVRLRETADPVVAATFANCAASLSVEGSGTAAVPNRQQVEERLQRADLRG